MSTARRIAKNEAIGEKLDPRFCTRPGGRAPSRTRVRLFLLNYGFQMGSFREYVFLRVSYSGTCATSLGYAVRLRRSRSLPAHPKDLRHRHMVHPIPVKNLKGARWR